MDEKSLKTSPWQRVIIILVALLLVGSTVLTYVFIVMSNSSRQTPEERIAELREQYDAKQAEIDEATKPLSDKYFKDFSAYETRVKSYNAAAANSEKLKIEDLKEGTGRQLGEGDIDYSAYYLGWCPDGSIFDSSFAYAVDEEKSSETSTQYTDEIIGLKSPLIGTTSLIDGWTQGIVGMKLGGVRQLSIPGELAYGETTEGNHICGMSNAPLKFIIMAVETDENVKKLNQELDDIYVQLYTAILGQSQSSTK